MKFRTRIILSASVFALGALSTVQAMAAPSECSVAGLITVGGMLGGDTLSSSSGGSSQNGNWNALFGEAAGLVNCDAWNFQADFAHYAHSATAKGKTFNNPEGHFGGDIFWRDPNVGDFGVQASYVSETSILNFLDGNADIVRGGVFGNYYLNDSISLGADAHLFTTTHNMFRSKGSSGKGYNGFELSANAKYYVTPDLKFSLVGDFMQSQYVLPSSTSNEKLGGVSATLQVDYQFNDSGLTGFIGGRLAHRVFWNDSSSGSLNLDDRQIFIGMTLPLGAHPGSMLEHDRTGPVNNTSTFLEKLPSAFDELFIAGLSSSGP